MTLYEQFYEIRKKLNLRKLLFLQMRIEMLIIISEREARISCKDNSQSNALQTSEVSGRSNLNFQCKPLLGALNFLMQGPQKCLTVYLQLKKEIES